MNSLEYGKGGIMITAMEVQLPRRTENHEALQALFERLCSDLGESSGKIIIKTIIQELGGLRVCFPDFEELYRDDRNRRIRNLFNGRNYNELAIMFGLHVRQIRRITKK
jgi:Mor family transcriptional regulator